MNDHLIKDINEFLLHGSDSRTEKEDLLRRALSALDAAHELIAIERASRNIVIKKIVGLYKDVIAPNTVLTAKSIERFK